ncbi:MAG: hypothetical protein LUB83_04795 [Prevotellaceae bacterium]|nr:hypothetical protein [Prevotellaceae bacterium]
MDIIERVSAIRKELQPFACNEIDYSHDPVLPFKGNGPIKLVVIGQDPTIRDPQRRADITCTLNLDKKGALKTYVESICSGIGLSLDNVYATNLYKYFYSNPPAGTLEVLQAHLQPNLALLKEELAPYQDCPTITLGEPVLKLLTDAKEKVRDNWDYKGCGYHCISPDHNELGIVIYPFPHQPSYSRKKHYKEHFCNYIEFMKADIFK